MLFIVLEQAVLTTSVGTFDQDVKPLEPVQSVTPETFEIDAWLRIRNVNRAYSLRWRW